MTPPRRVLKRPLLSAALIALAAGIACQAQLQPAQAQGSAAIATPLPDISVLMHEVEAKQRQAEEVRKNYIFHSVVTEQEVDGQGAVKKTKVEEFDNFWIKGVPVQKLVRKDGRDLTPEESKKESERVDKEASKASERRASEDAKGKQTDPRGNDEVTVSRLLELGAFTNPRRLTMAGRDTIAVDYTGDPKAKTRNRAEGVIRDMAGTVWVDEQDRSIVRIEGRFIDNFKIAGGMVANIRQGTSFNFQMTKINSEVWLPARVEGRGEARMLLFFKINGSLTAVYSDYRKFKTSATIVSVGKVKE